MSDRTIQILGLVIGVVGIILSLATLIGNKTKPIK